MSPRGHLIEVRIGLERTKCLGRLADLAPLVGDRRDSACVGNEPQRRVCPFCELDELTGDFDRVAVLPPAIAFQSAVVAAVVSAQSLMERSAQAAEASSRARYGKRQAPRWWS
jgi:hypothetical protein